MFLRIISESVWRNPRRKLVMLAALALGVMVATATLNVLFSAGDRLAREFRSFGANVLVVPQDDTLALEIPTGRDFRPVEEGAYLRVADLPKLKTIFWRNNILGFAPILSLPVEARGERLVAVGTWFEETLLLADGTTMRTGVRRTNPWWDARGDWPVDGAPECLLGISLARRWGVQPGESLEVGAPGGPDGVGAVWKVTGILSTGGGEDEQIIAPLAQVERLAPAHRGEARQVLVSALVKPEDDFARRDPRSMNAVDYDRWYCTPYVSSIAHQIEEALPGSEARPIRRVAESEGVILTRVRMLMLLITAAALVAAALTVSSTTASMMLERQKEIGLMKALGAANRDAARLLVVEMAVVALAGGAIGYGGGILLAQAIGRSVFGAAVEPKMVLFPLVLGIAVAVAVAGSLLPVARALRTEPAAVLRGE
ncbi:MAG TPA: ABC transporter permease [Candidatus Acidoferrales bacterium]